MKTSADMKRLGLPEEMIIPTGGGNLNESQIKQAHQSSSDSRGQTISLPGIGTIIPVRPQPTINESLELNRELNSMIKMQSSIDQVINLMGNKDARGYAKLGTESRGLIEGLRWRLINNVQVLRDFGVLSPSEIETIAMSVPDPNSFYNLITQGMGSDRFVEGVLMALRAEGKTKENEVRAYMQGLNIPHMTFPIHKYQPPTQQGSATQEQLNLFRSD